MSFFFFSNLTAMNLLFAGVEILLFFFLLLLNEQLPVYNALFGLGELSDLEGDDDKTLRWVLLLLLFVVVVVVVVVVSFDSWSTNVVQGICRCPRVIILISLC